jgi:hypothetical protein
MKRDYNKVVDGEVYGRVSTNKWGSECQFYICSLEEAEEMDDEEFEEAAFEALIESGMMEWCY